jgi:hypothetical protein
MRASRSFWQTLGDGSLFAIGRALVIGVPVFVIVQFAVAADRYQREVSLTATPAFNAPLGDLGGSDPGMPPGIAYDIEQEQRAEAAQRFCEENNHAGSMEDCVAGVMKGSIELPAPEPTRGFDPGPP